MPRMELVRFSFHAGYASDLSITSDRMGYTSGYIRPGSENVLVQGSGLLVPFKGFTVVEDIVGSRQNYLTDDGFAGVGDVATAGFGSVFKAIDVLFFMGGGPLAVNGLAILDGVDPVLASSQFQYLTRHNGLFDIGDDTHRFDVGHPRPSAPDVFNKSVPGPNQKPMSAVVAIAIWRADSITGQPSLPSESTTVTIGPNGSAIVVFPTVDVNGQDVWGVGGTLLGIQIGNIYELPTSRNGEILESTLAYERTVTFATITSGDPNIELDAGTPLGDRFTSADQGRRVFVTDKVDSWIVTITDAFNAVLNDDATNDGTGATGTITHAVDGYLRGFELSWSDDDLLAAGTLAPYSAFEPMDGRFCGFILDTFFIEDLEGTIFYSIPNYLSFPRLNRKIFTEDKATVYIDTGRSYQWRIAPQSISRLYYVPGETPIQLDIKTKNLGCKFPSNAFLGYDGRLMVWSGRPTIVDSDGSFNSTLHTIVGSEFDGWEDQTITEPVVAGYDPIGQYELWCKGDKIMPLHAPTGRWCSPIYITDWSPNGVIVSSVIVNERLRLVVREGSDLVQYEWNVGEGSDMTVQSYYRQLPGETTVTEVMSVVRPGVTDHVFTYTLIADFDREDEIGVDTVVGSADPNSYQVASSFRPNLRGCSVVGIKIEVPAADGRTALDYVDLYGEWNESYSNPRRV